MTKKRRHRKPETFREFWRANAIEATQELYAPILWLKNGIKLLFKLTHKQIVKLLA